jgi:hypothetical protein
MIARLRIAAGIALAIALGVTGARAELLAQATNNNGWDEFGPNEIVIPLTAAGATALSFATTQPNTFVTIIYNAECAVLGAMGSKFSIRITVDNKPTLPTPPQNNFVFCSATHPANKVYSAVSRVAVYKVPAAGNHTVRVYGLLTNGGTFASVDDTSLVVLK